MALEVRYVGNTNVGGWTTWNMNSAAQWSMLAGENGFYDEFRKAQANLRANIVAGNGQHLRLHGRAGHLAAADLPGLLRRHAARDTASNGNPANYTSANYRASSWYNNLGDVPEQRGHQLGVHRDRRDGHERPAERHRHGDRP